MHRHSQRQIELRDFLRARRAALSPEEVGIPRGRRRLTPGLRREELAALADVGVTWYTWLEQGRDIKMSVGALSRIARALRLSPSDHSYFFKLAGIEHETPPTGWEVPEATRNLIEYCNYPAFILDPMFNYLARNALARCIYGTYVKKTVYRTNHLWNVFVNPAWRGRYVAFETDAPNLVGIFRSEFAAHIDDTRFTDFVDALSSASAEFADMWNRRTTAPLTPTPFSIQHEKYGRLALHSHRLVISEGDGALLFMLSAADESTGISLARMFTRVRDHTMNATSPGNKADSVI